VDGLCVVWVLSYHQHGVSELALRGSGDHRRGLLRMDLAKNGIHFRIRTRPRCRGHRVALSVQDGLGVFPKRWNARGCSSVVGPLIRRSLEDFLSRSIEPVTTERKPPTEDKDWNRGSHSPPKRQNQVCHQAQPCEAEPKYLLLHGESVTPSEQGHANI